MDNENWQVFADYIDLEVCSDLQIGKYDIEVMNGDGYYDSDGNFVRFRSDDDWWYS